MFVGFIVVIAFIGFLLVFPIKWLWNYNMPYLFGLQEIDWWRAWCLHMLCSLLFKSSYSNSK